MNHLYEPSTSFSWKISQSEHALADSYAIIPSVVILVINPLTPGAFRQKKTCFLDILTVFRLDFGQIVFNLVENAFVRRQLGVLATSITSSEILARACAEIKILRWVKKWPMSLGFPIFESFFAFPFSLFLLFLLWWLTSYWACFRLKNF